MNLPYEDATLFFKLRWSLLAYVNRRLEIIPTLAANQDFSKRPITQTIQVRDALHKQPELLEDYVATNPDDLPPAELAIVASWRHGIHGDFYVMRYLKPYTVFMGGKPLRLYGVLSLYDPLEVVTQGAPLPIYIQATLLPFRDRIVYDGILNFYNVLFGRGISTSLSEDYSRLKEQEGIIEQLVGPAGQPQIRTNLARRPPKKPAPDWRPVLEEIAAQSAKLKPTNTKLQGAAVALLRAVAALSQAAFQEQDTATAAAGHLRTVRRALTKVERLLYEDGCYEG